MWTAIITNVNKLVDRVEVVVSYTNGKETFTEKYVTTCPQSSDWMDVNIKRKLAQLEQLAPFALTIATGAFSPATEKAVVVDIGREAFIAKLGECRHYQRATEFGLAVDTTAFANCLAELQKLWKAEYLELV